jgi:RNA polymerase sigma-70 factor (ECF subfamily)
LDNEEYGLVQLAKKGDVAAFESLVLRYERYVYNLALRVVSNPEDAQDLAQQAFIRAWLGLANFRGEARFSTWLYSIVTNLCYTRLPRIRRELAALDTDSEALNLPDERQDPEGIVLAAGTIQNVQSAFEVLPESYRLLVTLRHLQEMSYDEIAEVTGMPLGTVKTGIFRARKLLREALEKEEVNYG